MYIFLYFSNPFCNITNSLCCIFSNPEYKVLFDASRKVKPEDINLVAEMIKRMAGGSSDDTGC